MSPHICTRIHGTIRCTYFDSKRTETTLMVLDEHYDLNGPQNS